MNRVSVASVMACVEHYGISKAAEGYRQGLAFASCRLETLIRQGDGATHEDLRELIRVLDQERAREP